MSLITENLHTFTLIGVYSEHVDVTVQIIYHKVIFISSWTRNKGIMCCLITLNQLAELPHTVRMFKPKIRLSPLLCNAFWHYFSQFFLSVFSCVPTKVSEQFYKIRSMLSTLRQFRRNIQVKFKTICFKLKL